MRIANPWQRGIGESTLFCLLSFFRGVLMDGQLPTQPPNSLIRKEHCRCLPPFNVQCEQKLLSVSV